MVGITLAIIGLCTMVVQGLLIRRVVARFGERTSLLTGLALRRRGFRDVRPRADRLLVLGGNSGHGAVGICRRRRSCR